MLTVTNVGRRFPDGTKALRDVSLRVAAGEFIALLGPSGCGKSTLLRLIAGLDRPDTGSVAWDGAVGRIGFVFQDATLLPWASAAENVRLPLRLRGMARVEADRLVQAALERVGLAAFAQARPRALSGGMRMRVSIARALVQEPDLLLMDEPFAALDEFTRHGLQEELLALTGAARCAMVFVTHSTYEAAFLARRIVVMSSNAREQGQAGGPGQIAAEIVSDLPLDGRRESPAYHALVARIAAAATAARMA